MDKSGDKSGPSSPRVLFVTSELAPLIKTGGLADVSAGLPLALRQSGVDVRLLVPGYPQILFALRARRQVATLPAFAGLPEARLLATHAPGELPLWVIECPALYRRLGGPYADNTGVDWPDNYLRFGLLSHVAALLASDATPLTWRPDVVHCNDWQAGLAPAYLHFLDAPAAASVITIHNLAFQGIFPRPRLPELGLPASSFSVAGVEYHGSISFLKAGLFYADRITTVSPSYAEEIQTEAMGFGLQGLLATRAKHLTGILNGIDTQEWDPATDAHLASRYDPATLERKVPNKLALQERLGLRVDPTIPLLGMVSRLTYQKGIDLVLAIAPLLLSLGVQFAVLGSGDAALQEALQALAREHPGEMGIQLGYNEELAHWIEAGADIFLMPSRFEPCGLNQMFSQRYGTPPVVHATGGLADSVIDCVPATLEDGSASGFVFQQPEIEAFAAAVARALRTYRDPRQFSIVQRGGMARDFAWRRSAAQYLTVYQSLVY
jgi:starch synthase